MRETVLEYSKWLAAGMVGALFVFFMFTMATRYASFNQPTKQTRIGDYAGLDTASGVDSGACPLVRVCLRESSGTSSPQYEKR